MSNIQQGQLLKFVLLRKDDINLKNKPQWLIKLWACQRQMALKRERSRKAQIFHSYWAVIHVSGLWWTMTNYCHPQSSSCISLALFSGHMNRNQRWLITRLGVSKWPQSSARWSEATPKGHNMGHWLLHLIKALIVAECSSSYPSLLDSTVRQHCSQTAVFSWCLGTTQSPLNRCQYVWRWI